MKSCKFDRVVGPKNGSLHKSRNNVIVFAAPSENSKWQLSVSVQRSNTGMIPPEYMKAQLAKAQSTNFMPSASIDWLENFFLAILISPQAGGAPGLRPAVRGGMKPAMRQLRPSILLPP